MAERSAGVGSGAGVLTTAGAGVAAGVELDGVDEQAAREAAKAADRRTKEVFKIETP